MTRKIIGESYKLNDLYIPNYKLQSWLEDTASEYTLQYLSNKLGFYVKDITISKPGGYKCSQYAYDMPLFYCSVIVSFSALIQFGEKELEISGSTKIWFHLTPTTFSTTLIEILVSIPGDLDIQN